MDVSRGIFTQDSRKACTLDGSASSFAVVCSGKKVRCLASCGYALKGRS